MAATARIQLPKLPARPRDLLKYVSSRSKTASICDLLKPYIEYESRLREVFAQQPDHPAIKEDYCNIVPVFDGNESALRTHARDLKNESIEQQDKYILPLKDIDRRPTAAPATVQSLEAFKSNFTIFSEASLSELDWNNVVAAGSSVVTSLLPVPEEFADSKRTKREWYHEKFAPASDVDLFLYGLTEEQAIGKIKQIEAAIRDSVLVETTTVRTKNAITIASQYPTRHVQIVLRIYKSISEILTGFDVDCSCAAYDGKQVYASPRALAAFMTQINEIDLTRRSPSYENRLQKYAKRGFEVYWPLLDRKKIDPTIFERSFASTNGLARLLVYEKLPSKADRESYVDERRRERGRPTVSRFLQRRHGLPGNIKQDAMEEVNEAIEADAVSDYHTIVIPYGSKYTARRIERLLYTKDLLLNAEWNRPKDREVDLHRHPCFFGAADDVIGDCCGTCPKPKTNDEKEVAEEETKNFVSGNITFMKDDPGRQAIGSFNPLNEDDWSTMALVQNTSELCAAIVNDDLEFVEKWLAEPDNNVNERDYTGRTPLHLAVSVSSPRIVQCLVDHDARLIARLADGRTSLHLAAMRGGAEGLEIVQTLLRRSEVNEEKQAEKEDSKPLAQRAKHHNQIGDVEIGNTGNDGDSRDTDDVNMQSVGDTSAAMETTTEGSFVNVTGNETSQDESENLDSQQDDPDIINVDVYAWDVQVTALHYAVVLGNEEIVRDLVSTFAADVLVPVKLLDMWNRRPREAILTSVLVLGLPEHKKEEMLKTLIKLGASSSQADMDRVTALHRFVKTRSQNLVEILLHLDGPAAKRAVAQMITNVHYYAGSEVQAPLVTAIRERDLELTDMLLGAGATPAFSLQDIQRSRDYTYKDFNEANYQEGLDQPIVQALKGEQVEMVNLLLERGVDVNTITGDGHKVLNSNDASYYYGNPGETLLDVVQNLLRDFQKASSDRTSWDGTGASAPKPPAPSQKILSGVHEGTFKSYRVMREMRRGELLYENAIKAFDRQRREAQEEPGLEPKAQAIMSVYDALKSLEKHLISRGAKTFDQLFPDSVETNERAKGLQKRYRGSMFGTSQAWQFQPMMEFNAPNEMNDMTYDACEQVFEGAWSGDIERIKAFTTRMWGPQNDQWPLVITVSASEGFSLFTLAALKGHLETAEGILRICQQQYQAPDDANKGKRYHIRAESPNEEEEDDVELSDTEEEAPLTMDIADLPNQIKNTTGPEQLIDFTLPFERLNEVAPAGLPDENSWKKGPMLPSELTVLEYAIVTGNKGLFDWIVRLKLGYHKNAKSAENYEEMPFTNPTPLTLAMEFERFDMLDVLLTNGAGLPLDQLVQNSGVAVQEESKYYQGLTVYGSKKKAWAERDANQFNHRKGFSAKTPLLHAVFLRSMATLKWAMTEPERLYRQSVEKYKDTKSMKALQQAEGGFARQLDRWLRSRSDQALHLHILARKRNGQSDDVSMLEYLLSNLSVYIDSKSPTHGLTPLMLAFLLHDVAAAKVLIKAGADQTLRDKQGNNLLHMLLYQDPSQDNMQGRLDQRKSMMELIDSRIFGPMFLERSSGDQSIVTPLAKWIRSQHSFYSQQHHRHVREYFADERELDHPDNYTSKDEQEIIDEDRKVLQLMFDRSPDNKDLEALDGAGETVAHYCARNFMLPIFQEIISKKPSLLLREGAVGRTPFELIEDAWLNKRLQHQPDPTRDYDNTSMIDEPPGHFLALQRYEERKKRGEPLNLDLQDWVDRLYAFCLEVREREQRNGLRRRLVSLNEANVVAERLAARERNARDGARRAGPRSRAGEGEGEKEVKRVDDVADCIRLEYGLSGYS